MMTTYPQVTIKDNYGFLAEITPMGELRAVTPVKLVGAMLDGATVDANFWTTAAGASGTATQASGQMTLTCGTNAAGYGLVNSNRAGRYVAGASNRYRAQIQLGDTGIANNTRYWGCAVNTGTTITDGCYFKLSGTTLSICTMKNTVETAVASASWNYNTTVPTLTDCNTFEIYWTNKSVYFVINDVLMHKVSATSATWAQTMTFRLFHLNINTGNTADKTLLIRVMSISRMGTLDSESTSLRVTTAATYTAKRAAGRLHRIVINDPAAAGNTITVYDNTAASGTIIAVPKAGSSQLPVTLEYGLPFSNGLVLVSTGTWDATVVYE